MLNILLCDDSFVELEIMHNILLSIGNANVRTFRTAIDALSYVKDGNHVDISFLDIIMPGMKGTELASAMRECGYEGYIVFLTSSNEFAAESYGVKAFDYLLKPIDAPKIQDVLDRIDVDSLDDDESGVTVTTKKMIRKILHKELLYVEVNSRQMYFHVTDGSVLSVYGTLKEFSPQLLADERFAGCHNSFVVNMDFIKTIEGREITMKNGDVIPISKRNTAFKNNYLKRLYGKQNRPE